MAENIFSRKPIVSYVRRGDRMTTMQQRAWDRLRERWVIDIPEGDRATTIAADVDVVDWEAAFGRPGPLFVEIGSGKGDSPVAFAKAHPEANVVAFEVFTPGVAATLALMESEGVDNVRLLIADAADGLARLFEPASISEVRTFFPDPWHKKKHHKRRLVSAHFADVVADRMVSGGRWLIATDWPDYADHCHEVLDDHPRWRNVYPDGAPRDVERPLTRYEERGIRQGRPITDFVYEVRPRG